MAERIVANSISVENRLHADARVIKAVLLFTFVYAIQGSDIPRIIRACAIRAMEELTVATTAFAFVAFLAFQSFMARTGLRITAGSVFAELECASLGDFRHGRTAMKPRRGLLVDLFRAQKCADSESLRRHLKRAHELLEAVRKEIATQFPIPAHPRRNNVMPKQLAPAFPQL